MAEKKPVVRVSLESIGLSASAIDRSTQPCDDFYRFACGGWLDKTEIPDDKPRWSRSFNEIHQRNEADLRRILDGASAAPGNDSALQKIGTYYAACMDESGIEQKGLSAIKPLLAAARRVSDARSITKLMTLLHKHAIWAVFDISAEQDFKDATRYIAYLDQNGLGLPDRDYYFNEAPKSKELRDKYRLHVARVLELAGMRPMLADRAASNVMKLETEIAKVSKTKVERRDPKSLYNKIDRAGLEKTAPKFDWKAYFQGLGHPDIVDINVTSPRFFEGIDALIASVDAHAWRDYFEWQILNAAAPALPKAFVDESFRMEQALTGQKVQRARWKRCVQSTNEALGELLAQPFVHARFSGESKPAAERMVRTITDAFARELSTVDWMDEPTRRRAEQKLRSMAFLIGYPDHWKTYDFALDRTSYATNLLAARGFELERKLNKIGKPVDRSEWEMTPPTVNAYYTPLKNQMVFPAGILQPPIYAVTASLPVNLGAMGMVMGHELTHGFDDEGSQFDEKGNLSDWWTEEVRHRFIEKTGCVEKQYSAYEVLPSVHLDGKLTLGENIADMGGVRLAFQAYRRARESLPQTTIADGFDEDQQFFLAIGQIWCSKYREEYARMAAQVDMHSAPRFRVDGALADLPQFGEAFACKPGSAMAPKSSCAVW